MQSCQLPRHTQRGAEVTSLCIRLAVTIMVLPLCSFAHIYSNELQAPSCGLSFLRPEWAWFQASHTYMFVLGFAVLLCIICLSYVDLPHRLHNKKLHSGTKVLRKAKREALAVSVMCFLCWMPFHLACAGPGCRPAPHIPGYWYLLCHHQPGLCQLMPQSFLELIPE